MPESLLFIPDISGFTEFINSTESKHSQHVIGELLETVINANDIGLKVSEIEGDAVLFYRMGELPSAEELYEQAKKMYVAFHKQLRHNESHRICPCGACKSAANLTLKFVIHTGDFSEVSVSGHSKLHGSPVITAHRLMKNEISGDEYILFSGAYSGAGTIGEVKLETGSSTYSDIGEVPYSFVSIGGFQELVPEAEKPETGAKIKDPIRYSHHLNHNVGTVFEAISNYEYRAAPHEKIKEIQWDDTKVNRVGTRHLCVFHKGNPSEQETVLGDFGPDKLVMGERMVKPPPFCKDVITYTILEEKDGGTDVTVEFHARRTPIIGDLFLAMMKGMLKKIFAESASELRDYLKKNIDLFEGPVESAPKSQSGETVIST